MKNARHGGSLFWGSAVLFAAVACSSTTPKAGIGAKCQSNDGCQASSCNEGVCTKACSTDIDCLDPTRCFKGFCQLPLRVGAMYSGSASETEGWTYTLNKSFLDAKDNLGYVQLFVENEIYGGAKVPLVAPAVKRLVEEQKVDVVVATDSSQDEELTPLLSKYPNVKFIEYREPGSKYSFRDAPNVTTYTSNVLPAFYVAGKIAVQRTHAKRLGIIGSQIVSSNVQTINAFTRGAQSEDPSVVVEVRWVGYWFDDNATATFPYKGKNYFREDLITRQFIDSGVKVIAITGNSGRPIRIVEADYKGQPDPSKVFSIATNYRYSWRDLQTLTPFETSLGSAYYNFTPYLQDQLSKIHRQLWEPGDYLGVIESDLGASMIGFEPNTSSGIDDANVQRLARSMAGQAGIDTIFRGPYETTGQLDLDGDRQYDATQSVPAGQVLTQAQLDRMCWFVKGVVEKQNHDDTDEATSNASPSTPDVDAHVPDDTHGVGAKTLTSFGTDCRAYF